MKQKRIGIILMLAGIIFALAFYSSKVKEDKLVDTIIESQGGSCYLPDGTCLHAEKETNLVFIFGAGSAVALIIFGAYIAFLDRTQEELLKHQKEVSIALAEARKRTDEEKRFEAFLAGFSEDERNILRAVKKQDGIKQSTLRFRTGLSKSMLSVLLKGLEEKGVISRKESGKTKQVFLRNVF